MNSIEIEKCLAKYPLFKGVYPSDQLPKLCNFPCFIVVNFDRSDKSGTHWCAFYFSTSRLSYYFDSYGRYPKLDVFKQYLNRYSGVNNWAWNKRPLQSPFTDVCGHYCCLLCIFLSQGKTVNEFLNGFTNNQLVNDALVCKLYSRKCRSSKDGQFCRALVSLTSS